MFSAASSRSSTPACSSSFSQVPTPSAADRQAELILDFLLRKFDRVFRMFAEKIVDLRNDLAGGIRAFDEKLVQVAIARRVEQHALRLPGQSRPARPAS